MSDTITHLTVRRVWNCDACGAALSWIAHYCHEQQALLCKPCAGDAAHAHHQHERQINAPPPERSNSMWNHID